MWTDTQNFGTGNTLFLRFNRQDHIMLVTLRMNQKAVAEMDQINSNQVINRDVNRITAHLWVSLDIIVSEDDIIGGTRSRRDDIEGVLRLEALEVDAARDDNWQRG